MGWRKKVVDIAADLGDWLVEKSKKKRNAIILTIISLLSPLGFIFAASMIARSYRKRKLLKDQP